MSHPAHCRGCRGTGYRPGLKLTLAAYGRPLEYTTVKPCEHDHWNDEPVYEPKLSQDDPKAAAAIERGLAIGRHELWVRSGGERGERHPNARDTEDAA